MGKLTRVKAGEKCQIFSDKNSILESCSQQFFNIRKMVLNHSAFTLEDLYHPQLAHIISIVQYTCFIFNTLVFAFTSFVVLKKSPIEMNTYKYIMFAQILWTYFVDVNMAIWQPMLLFPYVFIYSQGILQVEAASAFIGLEFQIIIIASLMHSLVYGLAYRIVQIFFNTKIYWYLENDKNLFISFMISYLIFFIYSNSKFMHY